ncbi:alpha-glucosidase [Actinomyces bowdenii]|uniref:Alpha-glucosidase n=1 Tax=Actinomyces bowdenii TaxID=131109 RepID=A0A853EHQ4_9ACTO|nr:alpha-glucosidase [Actinomyces bowdenii]MBF0696636.1 alpha-glucosidase [Actinomyces bowdenii]NYS68809.1 alpha-glucosidase [Actinomyces bowdenii]
MSSQAPSLIVSPRHVGTQEDWWRHAVVYQVYPRSFADSNGDGYGDIPGITSRLDYLDALGVDVVWLSPAYRSPQDDNGYDISDYQDIDPLFGTLEDMDALIVGLHERGMRLVMDLVVNHTSDEHAWFVEARSSRTSAKRDWYIWRPARQVEGLAPGAPGTEPTNWGSAFSGPAWAWDEATGEFYLHLFSTKQPDLNWENPEVRRAVYDMMAWWLDRGVDGFRMDVINFISKTYPLADSPRGEGQLYGSGFDAVVNGPRIHEFLAEMHREVFAPRPGHILTVGEMPGVSTEQALLYTGPQRAELDMVFQFEHVGLADGPGGKFDPVPVDLVALKTNLASWQEALAPAPREGGGLEERGWNSLYWDNHDQPRAVSRFGDDDPAWRRISAKTLASILHVHRGTPYVYQGEELGMTNTVFTGIEDYRDLESINYFHERVGQGDDPDALLAAMPVNSRDNARTPVQWSDAEHAGFTTGEPWIAVAPNYREINAASQVGVAGSVFEHYRALIALRHDEDVLALGAFRLLAADHPSAWVVLRELEGPGGREQLLLIAQCGRGDLALSGAGGLWEALAAEGLEAGDWSGAEVLLRAGDPEVRPGSGRTGAPEVLAGWDSVLLRRRP